MNKDQNREHVFTIPRKDFEMTFFRAGGNGGQNQNKVSSACRIRHPDSGAVGECREERDQMKNRKIAFKRLSEHPKFKVWLAKRMHEINTGETTEQWVERQMSDKNLKVEVLDDKDHWVKEDV
jgi:protein subunit release factor B